MSEYEITVRYLDDDSLEVFTIEAGNEDEALTHLAGTINVDADYAVEDITLNTDSRA